MCPGQHYADAALWATLVGMLSVFAIETPEGVLPEKPPIIDGAVVYVLVTSRLHLHVLTGHVL